jgi:post-segregation antitoxin (ccd killing protein)
MPATLHDSLRERAQTTGSTIAGVVIEAITQQLENLSELVVSEHNTPATNAPTGPFPDPIAPKGPRVARESLAVVNLRVTAANLKVIDDLVTQHKAASRSQLVTAALRATL